jgi:hypothetical protein
MSVLSLFRRHRSVVLAVSLTAGALATALLGEAKAEYCCGGAGSTRCFLPTGGCFDGSYCWYPGGSNPGVLFTCHYQGYGLCYWVSNDGPC